jgi:adenosine deaminase
MAILTHELHLHLHGCVEAEDLWIIGKKRYKKYEDRLQWFSKEFENVWGYRPTVSEYFSSDDGKNILKKDYEITDFVDFPKFQSKFNLLIALLPIEPDDDSLIEFVLRKQAANGIKYGEYRMALPVDFEENQIHRYLTTACTAFSRLNKELTPFIGRAVISLSRDDKFLKPTYSAIKKWQIKNPELNKQLVAIDFGNYEEDSPPETKKEFVKTVLQDNTNSPESALAVLYHVGESFKTIGLYESVKWIGEAALMGCHRLGHCIALGLDPASVDESLRKGKSVSEIREFQSQTIAVVKSTKAIIESCPTSNVRIAGITPIEAHPLPRFLKEGLATIVSTDDPGIFGIDLTYEENLCREQLQLTESQISQLEELAAKSKSDTLSGRTI